MKKVGWVDQICSRDMDLKSSLHDFPLFCEHNKVSLKLGMILLQNIVMRLITVHIRLNFYIVMSNKGRYIDVTYGDHQQPRCVEQSFFTILNERNPFELLP